MEIDTNNESMDELMDNEDEEDGDDTENEETPPPNSTPGNFNLLSFENQMENVELVNPEFSWEEAIDPDGDSVTYSLFFGEGHETPSTLLTENLTETSFLYETTLPRNTIYSWQVIASDSEGLATSSEVHSFTTRGLILSQLTSDAEFDGREAHSSVYFDNRIWIIGGVDQFELANDVWTSENGINWTKETNNADFTSRGNHASVVFKDRMWIVGGIDNFGNPLNDVWSSIDGVNWTQENLSASFEERYNHTLTVFNNKMWLIGGQDNLFEFKDIWSTEDGINWVMETDDPGFPSRRSHTTIVFDDKMFVIGGLNANQGSGFGDLNDVWSSSDGVNWEIETVDADFSPRWGHSSIVYDGSIWIISGHRKSDIWSSKDGINWIDEIYLVPSDEIFRSRSSHTSVQYNNQILIIGGNTSGRNSEIWAIQP
ncbi:Kelch repeat-containing protein [Maribacter sp. 2304DJ31-5]|uniref:Kelch repeat-containing protein n=1 Tax=Maribacter sp. 2304DJ31-5 TaxID=3386273 RepID=UPI0039BCC1B5